MLGVLPDPALPALHPVVVGFLLHGPGLALVPDLRLVAVLVVRSVRDDLEGNCQLYEKGVNELPEQDLVCCTIIKSSHL